MPREIQKHDQIIDAFRNVDIISELVEQLPNGEFKHELDMDIILFGRSYQGKKVGPYARLVEFSSGETVISENTWESSLFYILVSGKLEASVADGADGRKKVGEIPPGNSFGEMALLSGTPRTASVSVADGRERALVLEMSRPSIRLLRKLPKFGRSLDRNYRDYGLSLTFNELKDFAHLDLGSTLMQRLNDAARFAVFEKDHVLFREGDPVNRVFFVRNGWIQRVSGIEFNPKAADVLIDTDETVGLDFLGPGTCLGLDAISQPQKWQYTATASARTEVIEVAISRLRDDSEMNSRVVPFFQASTGPAVSPVPAHPDDSRVIAASGREIETGVVDGLNLMVMDMAKCIRCGNCSYACHQVHGHTRLVRRGIHIERPVRPKSSHMQSVLVPTVCMHCQDAECLTGCPTGAIARFPDGEVDINPQTCIGCGDCATQCPYDAISMISRTSATGPGRLASTMTGFFGLGETKLPPPEVATEKLLAIKCNLCKNTGLNPPGSKTAAYSCEENCPTGALVRVNPREYFDEINRSIGLVRRDKTHAIGTNIHRSDPTATAWHIVGVLLVLILGVGALWTTERFTQDLVLATGGWLTMRWITGLAGLGGIVWVMAYPVRKQIYRRRGGALRYWLLTHIYIGVAAGVLLLVHGGTQTGGLLTSSLMVSFDLVIASGIFGAACYLIVPRFMTLIEPEPLLIEDLAARRVELQAALLEAGEDASDPQLAAVVKKRVRSRFLGSGYLLRQYLKREDLGEMLAAAREQFKDQAGSLSRNSYARLMQAVESAATLRRVDALIYLHKLLRVWIIPHVLFTAIMLVLLMIHIAQVLYFNVR